MSSSPTSAGAGKGALTGQRRKLRHPRIVIDRDAMHEIGNVTRVRQTIGQTGLVNQNLGAAVGQHIGDLGLLLAGAEQHRHQARHAPRRTSSARIRCGCRAAPRRGRRFAGRASEIPPRSRPIAAPPRASVIRRSPQTSASPSGFCAAASAIIAQMLFGRCAKCRHHAVAEARLEPHRGNGMLRPVHRGAPSQLLAFMP